MRNQISTKDLIKQRFSKEKAQEILSQADEEIKEIKWGGKRAGAGRKPKSEVLPFVRRLSATENQIIDDIRNNIISIDDINKLKQC